MSSAVATGQCGSQQAGKAPTTATRETIVKRLTLITLLAGSILAGLLSATGTAHADHDYVDTNVYASAPHVDTTVHTRTVIVRH